MQSDFLSDPAQLYRAHRAADSLLDGDLSASDLRALESARVESGHEGALSEQLAVKMALSRRLLLDLDPPVHLSVVFAVYREHRRILRPEEHPHGEDFLREKLRQLRWLFTGLEGASWDLTVVDDGCPEGSGRIAERILERLELEGETRVLFLERAIADGHPAIAGLSSTDDSRKGGSIVLGMWEAAQRRRDGHVILYTDADLSTHLGQSGLLIDPLLAGGAAAAIGSRREPASVVIKRGLRDTRGRLFIYLWKGLFPQLADVVDTQCGFKAFSAATVRAITPRMLERRFAFDVELLLRTRLRDAGEIVRVPIAWIDSEAASTTTDLQPYLPMLRQMVRMYRTYLPPEPDADRMAELIERLDEEAWQRLARDVPPAIAERDPAEFSRWRGVSTDALLERARC
jgi:hypothetical protein